MAFLDGAPPERLCQPMVDHFTAAGGELRMGARLKSIDLDSDGSVSGLTLVGGERVEADLYISAMPGAAGGGGGRRWVGGGGRGRGAAGGAQAAHARTHTRARAHTHPLTPPPPPPHPPPPPRSGHHEADGTRAVGGAAVL